MTMPTSQSCSWGGEGPNQMNELHRKTFKKVLQKAGVPHSTCLGLHKSHILLTMCIYVSTYYYYIDFIKGIYWEPETVARIPGHVRKQSFVKKQEILEEIVRAHPSITFKDGCMCFGHGKLGRTRQHNYFKKLATERRVDQGRFGYTWIKGNENILLVPNSWSLWERWA